MAYPEPKGSLDNKEKNNRKKLRKTEDNPDKTVALDQSIDKFTVLPLPEALNLYWYSPPNIVTIIFKAYKNRGWYITDKVQIDTNDTSET